MANHVADHLDDNGQHHNNHDNDDDHNNDDEEVWLQGGLLFRWGRTPKPNVCLYLLKAANPLEKHSPQHVSPSNNVGNMHNTYEYSSP